MGEGILNDFCHESLELLKKAQADLLSFDGQDNHKELFKNIHYTFLTLEASTGMMGMKELQNHMHLMVTNELLSNLVSRKKSSNFLTGLCNLCSVFKFYSSYDLGQV